MQTVSENEIAAEKTATAPTATLLVTIAAFEAIAFALWMGGLVALGAIAAPAVFGIVPAPGSADAMTVVFRRFDRVAMVCAAVALVAEAAFASRGGRIGRDGVARGVAVMVAAALAIVTGTWLSPTIEALHRGGAIRGLGDAGEKLERIHRWAEMAGKAELVLVAVALVLLLVKLARRR